jgi:CopG family transcriptional regulator, nickel-responsive regulator
MTEKTTRFGISLEADLLQRFDRHIRKRRYTNRSEAIRDLIRDELVREEWTGADGDVVGAITLVYDHHVRDLAGRLTSLQHEYSGKIVTSVHVHLDHHNCLEVMIVRGRGPSIGELAEKIRTVRGVKHVTCSMTTTGAGLH